MMIILLYVNVEVFVKKNKNSQVAELVTQSRWKKKDQALSDSSGVTVLV